MKKIDESKKIDEPILMNLKKFDEPILMNLY